MDRGVAVLIIDQSDLRGCQNDAKLMETLLTKSGYEIAALNQNQADAENILIYYSGHTMSNENAHHVTNFVSQISSRAKLLFVLDCCMNDTVFKLLTHRHTTIFYSRKCLDTFNINGNKRWNGALTMAFIDAIAHGTLTHQQVHDRMRDFLARHKPDQTVCMLTNRSLRETCQIAHIKRTVVRAGII